MGQENFARIAAFTMAQEGGAAVSNHAADPGGLTKYGISARAWPDLDIANLTEAQALDVYRRGYWEPCRAADLPWPLDLAVFDYAFNSGVNTAARDLQRALGVKVDAVIGAKTREAAAADPRKTALDLNARRLLMLGTLATWRTFGLGWSRRVLNLQREAGS